MSQSYNVFGDDGYSIKNEESAFDNPDMMADVYRSVQSAMGKSGNAGMHDLREVCNSIYHATADLQGEFDNVKANNTDFSSSYPTESHDGKVVPTPVARALDGEIDEATAIATIRENNRQLLGVQDGATGEPEPATDGGNDGEDSREDSDSNTNSDDPIQVLQDEIKGFGDTLADKVRDAVIEEELQLNPETVEQQEELSDYFSGTKLEMAERLLEKGDMSFEMIVLQYA
jgi:hypothetical protein